MAFFTPIIRPGMNLWNIKPTPSRVSVKTSSRKRACADPLSDGKTKVLKVVSVLRSKRSSLEVLQRRSSVPQTSNTRARRSPGGCNGLCTVRSCKARLATNKMLMASSVESLQSLSSQRYMSLQAIVEEDDIDDTDGSVSSVSSSENSLELARCRDAVNMGGSSPQTMLTESSLSERKHGPFLRQLRKILGLEDAQSKSSRISAMSSELSSAEPHAIEIHLVSRVEPKPKGDTKDKLIGFVRSLSNRRRS